MPEFTIAEQIAEVERELAIRKRQYARWVKNGKTNQAAADLQLGRMGAVLETLRRAEVLMRSREPGQLITGEAYGPAKVRQDERARVMAALRPLVHSDVLVKLDKRLEALPS